MTEREALELTIELWEWLAEHPREEKQDWPRWLEFPSTLYHCFLCEYAGSAPTGNPNCPGCPLFGKWTKAVNSTCFHRGSPFRSWIEMKRGSAQRIVVLCKEALREL